LNLHYISLVDHHVNYFLWLKFVIRKNENIFVFFILKINLD